MFFAASEGWFRDNISLLSDIFGVIGGFSAIWSGLRSLRRGIRERSEEERGSYHSYRRSGLGMVVMAAGCILLGFVAARLYTGRSELLNMSFAPSAQTEQQSYSAPCFDDFAASSFIDHGISEFGPEKAFDGLMETSWQELVGGLGKGEWIICSSDETQYVSRVSVYPGNCYDLNAFYENGRPTKVRVELAGESYTLEVNDAYREPAVLELKKPVACRTVKVTILEAVTGNVWRDTAIAEIVIE